MPLIKVTMMGDEEPANDHERIINTTFIAIAEPTIYRGREATRIVYVTDTAMIPRSFWVTDELDKLLAAEGYTYSIASGQY